MTATASDDDASDGDASVWYFIILFFFKFRKLKKIIFRLRNGRETLEQKKEQRVYMHTNIAHARAVAIKQRPLPYFFTQGGPKKTS